MIYIEYILIDNFLMDFILLFCAVRFGSRRIRFLRIFLAAILGAFYAFFAAVYPFLTLLPIKFAASFLMCLVAVPTKPFCNIFFTFLRFVAISFLFGGAALASLYFLNGTLVLGNCFNFSISRYVLIGSVLSILIIESILRNKLPRTKEVYTLFITLQGYGVRLNAFLDTGNRLKDHGGGGVIIADKEAVFSQLPLEIIEDFCAYPNHKRLNMREFSYQSVAGQGKLSACFPDHIVLTNGSKTYAVKAYLALTEHINENGCSAIFGENLRITLKAKETLSCKKILSH